MRDGMRLTIAEDRAMSQPPADQRRQDRSARVRQRDPERPRPPPTPTVQSLNRAKAGRNLKQKGRPGKRYLPPSFQRGLFA
jgi:hypothetical protein